MRLGVAPGLIVKIGLAIFDRHRSGANIGIADDIQSIGGGDCQGVLQRQSDWKKKLMIGVEVELSWCI